MCNIALNFAIETAQCVVLDLQLTSRLRNHRYTHLLAPNVHSCFSCGCIAKAMMSHSGLTVEWHFEGKSLHGKYISSRRTVIQHYNMSENLCFAGCVVELRVSTDCVNREGILIA
jgi:hypothetical protein